MQHDELIWQIIGHSHCSYRAQVGKEKAFCRNEYNVSGLCNRSCCPLANSRYATVREHDGKCYLYMKTIERAHSPKNLWERVPLSKNYLQALQQLDEQLEHWPDYLKHKNKQRLTKITQYLIRMRKLAKAMAKPQLVRYNKKEERLLARKEAKALVAADLERSIEQQLLTRLKQGTYGDIYNFPSTSFNKAVSTVEEEFEDEEAETAAGDGARKRSKPSREEEDEDEEEYYEEEEEMDDEDGPTLREFLEAGSDDEDEEDEEDDEDEDEDGPQSELVDDDEEPDLDDEEQDEYDRIRDGRALPEVDDDEDEDDEDDGGDDDDHEGDEDGYHGAGRAGSSAGASGKGGALKGARGAAPAAKGKGKGVRFAAEEEDEDGHRATARATAGAGGGKRSRDGGKPDWSALRGAGASGAASKPGKARLEIEYEDEDEEDQRQTAKATMGSGAGKRR